MSYISPAPSKKNTNKQLDIKNTQLRAEIEASAVNYVQTD